MEPRGDRERERERDLERVSTAKRRSLRFSFFSPESWLEEFLDEKETRDLEFLRLFTTLFFFEPRDDLERLERLEDFEAFEPVEPCEFRERERLLVLALVLFGAR